MLSNRFFYVSIILVLLAGIGLTLREATATAALTRQDREAQRLQRVQAADQARWQAMAEFYRDYGLLTRSEPQVPVTGDTRPKLLTSFDAGEISAYRWAALAMFYRDHGLLTRGEPQLPLTGFLKKPLTDYDAGEISAYRWQAMGTHYLSK